MFLDAVGTPKEVTPQNLHEYPYELVSVEVERNLLIYLLH